MDLINIADYPASQYDAYWEIDIDRRTSDWTARIYGRSSGGIKKVESGKADNMVTARKQSQYWVRTQMDQFKKG